MKTKLKFFGVLLAMIVVGEHSLYAEDRNGNTLTYDFTAYKNYGNDVEFSDGGIVKNSLGEDMHILSETHTGTRFAVPAIIEYDNNNQYKTHWFVRRPDNTNAYLYAGNSGDRNLSIMGLTQGDKVTIVWGNISLTNNITLRSDCINELSVTNIFASNTQYTMKRSGSLDLSVGRYIAIYKVIIEDNGNTNHVTFNTSGSQSNYTYYGNSYSPAYKVQLSARSFTEPAISVYPSTANITYSVSNVSSPTGKNVAVMNENPAYKGDVMFKNIGLCQVTATINVNGTTYSDSYYVEVWDNVAEYVLEDNGTKYRLTAPGVLENRVVTAVPGMTMKFGVPNNYPNPITYIDGIVGNGNFNYTESNADNHYQPNSVVIFSKDGHMVTNIFADNGWQSRYPYKAD